MQQQIIVEYLKRKAYEQGFQQGFQQGAQKTNRKHILKVLKFRFQFDAAQTFKPTLDGINDLQRLKQLFRTALRVETVKDFANALGTNDN